MATAPTLTQIQQGGTPATIGDIVNAIQNQYNPTQIGYGQQGVSYGAGRFLSPTGNIGGTGATGPVAPTGTVAGGTAPSWFTPGQFDVNKFKAVPNLTELNKDIATGEVYRPSGSGGSSFEPNTASGDIYSSLFNPMPSWLPIAAGLLVPGAGMLFNAVEGYAQNEASKYLQDALKAYGVENMPEASNPLWSAVLGVFNADTDATKFSKNLVQSFQTPESLFGYYDASTNSSVAPIVNHILNETNANVSANQVGYLGNAVASYVQGEIAGGKNLNDAFLSVAQQFGMNPQDAAAYAVNAVVDAATADSIYGVPVDPAAKALAADPMGLFISNLGLLGQDTTKLEVAMGLKPSETEQGLIDANAALQQAFADLQTGVTGQINTQSQQFQTLLNQYQELGLTQNEALQQTIADMQTNLTGQINTQSTQFQTLLNQYQELGLTRDEAMQQTIADMQTDMLSQINAGYTNTQIDQAIQDALNNVTVTPAPAPELATPTPLGPPTGDYGGSSGGGYTPATPSPVTDTLAGVGPGTPLGPATGDGGGSSGGGSSDSSYGDTSYGSNYGTGGGYAYSSDTGGLSDYGGSSFGDSDAGSDSGDSGGGGGGGGSGRYCCSRMVHHGLWDVNHEFARLTIWSRKQPNWWRSGYPVWGKIVAKHLLGKVGFWTDVMQAFYDNKVRKKPRTIKSTIGELVIFPGAFVCGMIWKDIPTKATLADPKEFV